MACPRCTRDEPLGRSGWCATCERDFDTWSRRHATDILWALMGGGMVVATAAVVLPLLGVMWIVSACGIFAGFATIGGLYTLIRKRRRRQFLSGAAMPRAYLPAGKPSP